MTNSDRPLAHRCRTVPILVLCTLLIPHGTVATAETPGKSAASDSPASTAAVREITTLTASERLSLPETTKVSINGHVVTLSTIRAFHNARTVMAAQATTFGRQSAALLSSYWTVIPPPTPILMPQSELQKYAKDYQDFCTAAQATACIYLPILGSWYSSKSLDNPSPLEQSLIDPLVTDVSVCKEGGGTLGPDGCIYTYPTTQTTDFQPISNPRSTSNCPLPAAAKNEGFTQIWSVVVEPHGAASAKFTPPSLWPDWLIQDSPRYAGDNPATCVVQVLTERGL